MASADIAAIVGGARVSGAGNEQWSAELVI